MSNANLARTIKMVDELVDLVAALRETGGMSVPQYMARKQLSKSTVFGYFRMLLEADLATRDKVKTPGSVAIFVLRIRPDEAKVEQFLEQMRIDSHHHNVQKERAKAVASEGPAMAMRDSRAPFYDQHHLPREFFERQAAA